MKKLENILKKFHNQDGITGADVATAILIIVTTIGVITGIYINITNGSKENIRYSAATRIATQISENIKAMSYDEVISNNKLQIDSASTEGEERKIFNVSVPKGYSVKITSLEVSSELDIIRKYNIEVSYKVGAKSKDTIDLQVIKQRELLEQTNIPDVELLPEYKSSSKYFYPIKMTSNGYTITTTSDKDWYNYDSGYYANIYVSNMEKEVGDIVAPNNGERYVWVPRFAKTTNEQLNESNFAFLYGTSKHRIVFKNVDLVKNFYTYTVDFSDGTYNDAQDYVENTFKDNDGITGMWYLMGSTENELNTKTAFDALNVVFPIKN